MNNNQLKIIKKLIETIRFINSQMDNGNDSDLDCYNNYIDLIKNYIASNVNGIYYSIYLKLQNKRCFSFKNYTMLLEFHEDYLRALKIILEDTNEEDIPEFYLNVDEDRPLVDNSADIEPYEPKQVIEYADEAGTIAKFRPLEDDGIAELEDELLELIEKKINEQQIKLEEQILTLLEQVQTAPVISECGELRTIYRQEILNYILEKYVKEVGLFSVFLNFDRVQKNNWTRHPSIKYVNYLKFLCQEEWEVGVKSDNDIDDMELHHLENKIINYLRNK